MTISEARIEAPKDGMTGLAPGYMRVMHTLCIECHKEKQAEKPQEFGTAFARCDGCHGIMDGTKLKALEPYVEPSSLSLAKETPHAAQ
jgi:hypothetical protein